MARTLLGGIAIAAGSGLVIGFSFYRSRADVRRRQPVNLEPLIERLDCIEARVAQVERCPAPELSGKLSADVAVVQSSLLSIDERLAAQSRDIELLRIRAAENEKLEAEILRAGCRFKEVAAALPAEIETNVVLRIEDFRGPKSLHVDRSFNALVAHAKKCVAAQ
jgi:hypothetical protein